MKCDICGEVVQSASFGTMAGIICKKPECEKKAKDLRDRFFRRKWKAGIIKEAGDLNESLTLFAFQWLKELKKQSLREYEKIRQNNPLMTTPEQLQLRFTEMVLEKIPREYYESENARGHERMFHGGTFRLTKPIPEDVLVTAMCRAGLLQKTND